MGYIISTCYEKIDRSKLFQRKNIIFRGQSWISFILLNDILSFNPKFRLGTGRSAMETWLYSYNFSPYPWAWFHEPDFFYFHLWQRGLWSNKKRSNVLLFSSEAKIRDFLREVIVALKVFFFLRHFSGKMGSRPPPIQEGSRVLAVLERSETSVRFSSFHNPLFHKYSKTVRMSVLNNLDYEPNSSIFGWIFGVRKKKIHSLFHVL